MATNAFSSLKSNEYTCVPIVLPVERLDDAFLDELFKRLAEHLLDSLPQNRVGGTGES